MHGAAVSFARRMKNEKPHTDLIVVSDFLDLATFKGLSLTNVPIILYFHENQFAYPWSETDPDKANNRDRRYMWINYTSALSADALWFNSGYNRRSFLDALPYFMNAFPDDNLVEVDSLYEKSLIMPVGLKVGEIIDKSTVKNDGSPVILWNHRWEYDKNPDFFFNTLFELKEEGLEFRVLILGTKTNKYPAIFDQARKQLSDRIMHFGPLPSRQKYISALVNSDILPVTSRQEFFGISVIEAIAAGAVPLLPGALSYVEHLDQEALSGLFYGTPEEFKEKLVSLIINLPTLNLKEKMLKYDWELLVGLYDDNAVNVVNNR